MNIYLIDHSFVLRSPEKCAWHLALIETLKEKFSSTMYADVVPFNHPGFLSTDSAVFVHSNGREDNWRHKADSVECCCHIVLVRSAGRQSVEASKKGNFHGCYWSPVEFKSKSRREISLFVEQITRGDSPDKVEWSLLEAPRSDELLAFRLLCEAKQICGSDPKKEFAGITVYSPMSIDDWLRPFGVANSDRIADVAGKVGSGDIKDKATAVLNAARGEAGLKVAEAISDFLLATAPRAKGN